MLLRECKNALTIVICWGTQSECMTNISQAAGFYINHHCRLRMGSSKMHPNFGLKWYGIMGDFFVQITKLFSHPTRNYCPYKMPLEIGLINSSLLRMIKWGQVSSIISGSPRRKKCKQNEVKVKFHEQTEFQWNNISITASHPRGIMLHATHHQGDPPPQLTARENWSPSMDELGGSFFSIVGWGNEGITPGIRMSCSCQSV